MFNPLRSATFVTAPPLLFVTSTGIKIVFPPEIVPSGAPITTVSTFVPSATVTVLLTDEPLAFATTVTTAVPGFLLDQLKIAIVFVVNCRAWTAIQL